MAPPPFPSSAGLSAYLKAAFLHRWNLLLLGGALAASLLTWPDALLPFVGALEVAYLATLVSVPKFRRAIDAEQHARATSPEAPAQRAQIERVTRLVASLPALSQRRFDALRRRSVEMRRLADQVRGQHTIAEHDDPATSALDRMLWVFLRLLASQHGLERFLQSNEEQDMRGRIDALKGQLAEAGSSDERIQRSLKDNLAVTELRLANYLKARDNARFVALELDRLEGKVQALAEMAVNRQQPDELTSQVDAVADTMKYTEQAITELEKITGLEEQMQEPPPMLNAPIETLRQG